MAISRDAFMFFIPSTIPVAESVFDIFEVKHRHVFAGSGPGHNVVKSLRRYMLVGVIQWGSGLVGLELLQIINQALLVFTDEFQAGLAHGLPQSGNELASRF